MKKQILAATLFFVCAHAQADCDYVVNNEMHDRVQEIVGKGVFKLHMTKLTEPGLTSDIAYYRFEFIPGGNVPELRDAEWFVIARESGGDPSCTILSAKRISKSF